MKTVYKKINSKIECHNCMCKQLNIIKITNLIKCIKITYQCWKCKYIDNTYFPKEPIYRIIE